MRIPKPFHSWSLSPREAIQVQRALASRVIPCGRLRSVRWVAGVDVAFTLDKKHCIAGAVVWDIEAQDVLEQKVARTRLRFPYIPGLLSFREAPAILAVLRKLRCEPDVLMFDGQGLAHPRKFGLACHVGVLLNRPSLGCAKSILVGKCEEPDVERGSVAPIMQDGAIVGMALRTRDRVKPVYVSVGHRLSLGAAVEIAFDSCTRYRLPEPTRLADRLVAREKANL